MGEVALLVCHALHGRGQLERKVTGGRHRATDHGEQRFVADAEIAKERTSVRSNACKDQGPLQSCQKHGRNGCANSKQLRISGIFFRERKPALVLP
jgi:hypothetical protein